MKGLGLGAIAMTLGMVASASEAAPDAVGEGGAVGIAPERIDVVYERLGVQRRTLEAVVQIVTQLEAVADQSDAAAELLSDLGDPTDRLKRALDEVVSERRGRSGNAAVAPVLVEAQTAMPADEGPAAEEKPRQEVAVVYAERGGDGRGRVVVAVRGAHYAARVGQRVLAGEDEVKVVRIDEADDGLTVVLRVNGGAAVRRRVRS